PRLDEHARRCRLAASITARAGPHQTARSVVGLAARNRPADLLLSPGRALGLFTHPPGERAGVRSTGDGAERHAGRGLRLRAGPAAPGPPPRCGCGLPPSLRRPGPATPPPHGCWDRRPPGRPDRGCACTRTGARVMTHASGPWATAMSSPQGLSTFWKRRLTM